MNRYSLYISFLLSILLVGCNGKTKKEKETVPEVQEEPIVEKNKPNVVVIYVDDLGYGDVGAYGATKVKTPNIDKIAQNGVRFTDAHCTASTCTPSRFSLLTGSYAFRNKAGILEGDAPLLISPQMATLPKMLQASGYVTGVVGKWHLGLGDGDIDWNKKVTPGPAEIGFDYSFLIPATGDRVPCVYMENQEVINLDPNDPIRVSYKEQVGKRPTGISNPELLTQKADKQHSGTIINSISRIGYMEGGEKAVWVDEDFPNVLTKKAKGFIKENKQKPFFLYLAYHDIHVPRIANKQFKGKSDMGVRGDVIAQMDWCTGQVVDYLKELGLDNNTLVIFSSDNGPVITDGYEDDGVKALGDHKPAGIYRGGKYSAFEAGTRVPTIAYWPSVIAPKTSDAVWSQVDLYASLASMIDYKLKPEEAPDSFDMLEVIKGNSNEGRKELIEESYTLSLRKGDFKYIKPVKKKRHNWIENSKNIESGLETIPQLYDLSKDPEEKINIADQKPVIVQEMDSIINVIRNKETRVK